NERLNSYKEWACAWASATVRGDLLLESSERDEDDAAANPASGDWPRAILRFVDSLVCSGVSSLAAICSRSLYRRSNTSTTRGSKALPDSFVIISMAW